MNLANYELVDIIGEGGFGLVYKARQLSTQQVVAIKLLKFDNQASEEKMAHQRARFERETQLTAQLNHPNIVKLLDKGETDEGQLFAVFEYVEGQTLKELIIEKNGLSAVVTGELLGQILDGLASAHAQGIVHRDLKPTNIMITKTGLKEHAKILDFGIGAFTASFQPQDYRMLTLTKETIGTPAYSAPEQLRGEPPTTKSDLYAWGLMLLECLTGAPVMRGESVGEVFEQQLSANQVPLPPALADHPLGKLLRNVLEKNPMYRSADAQRVANEFAKINFQNLVGQIQMPASVITDAEVTSVTDLGYMTQKSEKRQISVLCVQLSLATTHRCTLDEETLDTMQEDQLSIATDMATRYGGYIAGTVADTLTVYFGYPQKSENDARYAGRTALELISQAKKRSALLLRQHGVELDVRIGMHSGSVLLRKNAVPKGLIPNTAFALLNRAQSDSVLVSSTTKTLLDPFLEFESGGMKRLSKNAAPEKTFLLKGERPSEALSFLRPWSANRRMVGREVEVKEILGGWQKIDMGHGQAILITGQAGIGKSKLIHEAKRELGNDGPQVKEARCLPEHRNNALYPFFELLKKHLGMLDLEESSQKISRLRTFLEGLEANTELTLPILCSWLSIPLDETVTGSQLPPDKQKEILMNALVEMFHGLGEGGKYLLVVEDLHWADPTSLELIDTLLKDLKPLKTLMLLTGRPDFKPEWKYHGLTYLPLKPLDEDRTRRMILGVLDTHSVDQRTVEYISQRADGVPLFIEELTHMLLEREFLILKDDTYQLDETQDMSRVPVRLNDLLSARLDKLGFAKETAQLAAAIGREFSYELLTKASLRDEALIQGDLDTLAQADLIYHRRMVESDFYLFRHALIRDAAYESLANKERVDIHSRLAVVLEEDFPEQVAQDPMPLANHFAHSDQFIKAIDFGIQAARKMLERSAMRETINICEIIKFWLVQLDDEVLRLDREFEVNTIQFPASVAVFGLGTDPLDVLTSRNKEIDEILVAQGYTDHIDEGLDARFIQEYIAIQGLIYSGNSLGAIDRSLVQLAEADQAQSVSKRLILACGLSQAYYITGQITEGENLMEETLTLYNVDDHGELWKTFGIEPKAYLMSTRALCYAFRGQLNTAYQVAEDAACFAETVGCETFVDFGKLCVAWSAYFGDDKAQVVAINNTYFCNRATRQDDVLSKANRVLFDWTQEHLEFLEAYFDEMLAMENFGAAGSVWEPLLGEVLVLKNMSESSEQRMRDTRTRCENFQDLLGLPLVLEILAVAIFNQSNEITTEIDDLFSEGISLANNMGAYLIALHVATRYAEIQASVGEPIANVSLIHELIDRIESPDTVPLVARARAVTT